MLFPEMDDVATRAASRKAKAETIVTYANHAGLCADLPMVLRNFHVWQEWYLGRYATGYLIRKTGVRKAPNGRTN